MYVFDDNDLEAISKGKLEYFYGNFSYEVRRRLLSRNLIKPANVYDVLYPETREQLLAKNEPFETNLEESSQFFRDNLLSKIILKETDLEEFSKNFRKSLLSRQKIQEDRDLLQKVAEDSRKELLSKNSPQFTSLEKYSTPIRKDLLSKNVENSFELEKSSKVFRNNLISKNVPQFSSLEEFSAPLRDDLMAKNVEKETDLEDISQGFRKRLLSSNKISIFYQTLEQISKDYRFNLLSKNVNKINDLEKSSITFRKDLLAKNSPQFSDLSEISEDYRNSLISKNVPQFSDLEEYSLPLRKNLIAKNVLRKTDISKESEQYRKDLIAKNKVKSESDLSVDMENYRNSLLAKNVVNITDLEVINKEYRRGLLSKNNLKTIDLSKISENYRLDLLSKNNYRVTDLSEISLNFRKDLLSKNKITITNLSELSEEYRKDLLSLNKNAPEIDILKISKSFRENLLSKNKITITDLLSLSKIFRTDLLSKNNPKITDLQRISSEFRENLLSLNVPETSDLLKDSLNFRLSLLKKNIPNFSDLLTDSEDFRDNLLSLNILKKTDLEKISSPFRRDLLSRNIPKITSLLEDSKDFRKNLVTRNIGKQTDLLKDSKVYRDDLLSRNIITISDLLSLSFNFRNNLLSRNVPKGSNLLEDSKDERDNLLKKNVPSFSNLLTDSKDIRNVLISKNIPKNSDILSESEDFRKNLIDKNNPTFTDLLSISKNYRDNLLSKNGGGLLGYNIYGSGTQTFFGVSRVFTQGIIYRELLKVRNISDFQGINGSGGSRLVGPGSAIKRFTDFHLDFFVNKISRLTALSKQNQLYTSTDTITKKGPFIDGGVANYLQGYYGTTPEFSSTFSNSSPSSIPSFTPGSFLVPPLKFGKITESAQKFSKQISIYNLSRIAPGDKSGIGELQNYQIPGYQDLINSTIGGFRNRIEFQVESNTTPISIIQKNEGQYLAASPEELIKPGANNLPVGSAESMMAKTSLGNPMDDEDFIRGNRGVRRIVNVIKNSDTDLGRNFRVQDNRVYVTGVSGKKEIRFGKQRFTIKNPYAPVGAGRLLFYLENYSIPEGQGRIMYFPPYVKSFSHAHNANWNSTDFLGRPEPIYTYNNSKRNGSITFVVLTDYAQEVDIGIDYSSIPNNETSSPGGLNNNSNRLRTDFEKHFTDLNSEKLSDIDILRSKSQALDDEIKQLNIQIQQNPTEKDSFEQQRAEKIKQRNEINAQIAVKEINFKEPNYSEKQGSTSNIYADLITPGGLGDLPGSNGDSQLGQGTPGPGPLNTLERINRMKEKLMFQPSYFSGDKVDFLRRIEFLEKLCLPSKNDKTNTGFSFINPPVAHIHLGDWFNHDIIIDSVNFSYDNAPWTVEGGRVQPMWAEVQVSFQIIGPYRHGKGGPLTSTDVGGFHSDRKTF